MLCHHAKRSAQHAPAEAKRKLAAQELSAMADFQQIISIVVPVSELVYYPVDRNKPTQLHSSHLLRCIKAARVNAAGVLRT